MRILACLGFLLSATAANAHSVAADVNREAKAVTLTGPTATATMQVARAFTSVIYTTTVARSGGYRPMGNAGYRPTGSGGYRPMGSSGYHPTGH